MAFTDEQLKEAAEELRRREEAKTKAYMDERNRLEAEREERFLTKMDAVYPNIDRDTRDSIHSDYRDYYEW
jgi:hypothetical protein